MRGRTGSRPFIQETAYIYVGKNYEKYHGRRLEVAHFPKHHLSKYSFQTGVNVVRYVTAGSCVFVVIYKWDQCHAAKSPTYPNI